MRRDTGDVSSPRRIYAVDVGSTLKESFAWVRVNPERPGGRIGSRSIERLVEQLVADLRESRSVALGFEAPLFIPVPIAAARLSRGRDNEGSPPWSASVGLTVTSLGLHQAAWILRHVCEQCGNSVNFQVAPDAWPPGPEATIVFCWEAFVSGPAKSETHIGDAATAAMAFLEHERRLVEATQVTAEHPLSLIGTAALWSGLAVGAGVLRTATVVLRPEERFKGAFVEV